MATPVDSMDQILKLLSQGKKASISFMIALSLFLGYQYAEFKFRLSRIEERISVLEQPKPKQHANNGSNTNYYQLP